MTLAQAHKEQFGKVSYPYKIYDANDNGTYYEDSSGFWSKRKYDANGNRTYYEDSTGYWVKREYDANGKLRYYENSNGYWNKREYDANGNETYYEDSKGRIEGNKQSSCDGKVVEIDGKKYKLKEI